MPTIPPARVIAGLRLLLLGVAATTAAPAFAIDYFWTAGSGSWTADGNWDQGLVPEADYEEVAVVSNGGIATVSEAAPDVAAVVLGQAAGESGTLIITDGGSLTTVNSGGAASLVPPDGRVNIALDGDALVEVQGGGYFSGVLLDINSTGTLRLGGASDSGSATVFGSGNVYSDGVVELYGPGHSFDVAGNVYLEGNSRFSPVLTSATASPMTAGGTISLGGALVLSTDGYAFGASDSVMLMEAAAITGGFASIDISGLPELATGRVYETSVVDGGAGQQLYFGVNSYAMLSIDTDTGAATINSPSGDSIEVMGYSVLSSSGLLDPSGWTSLEDQSAIGWEEASPSATDLSELNPSLATVDLGSGAVDLGAVYTGPAAFGDSPDLAFEYVTPGDGEVVVGLIEYTGSKAANNLLLTVDPVTGEAQLKNSSAFSVSLEGYAVASASGSLDSAGWDSMQDQSVTGWEEANPSELALSELMSEGASTLGPGSFVSLGGLFDTAGSQDLTLEFLLEGEATSRFGVVAYGAIESSIPGDYNGDGYVDAADYVVWRNGGSPDSSAAGLAVWKANYGAGSIAATSEAVPEPASALLGATLLLGAGLTCTRSSRV